MTQDTSKHSQLEKAKERLRIREDRFSRWKTDFRSSGNGRDAINSLYQITERNPDQHQPLEHALLLACFNAQFYEKHGDSDFRAFTETLESFRDSIPKQSKSIKQLTISAKANPLLIENIFRRGNSKIEARTSRELLLDLLKTYSQGLAGYETVIKKQFSQFALIEGCLHFKQARRRKFDRRSGATNGLIFELTMLIRKWGSGDTLTINGGATMPRTKLPSSSFSIIAAFINATFPTHKPIDGETAKNRLKKLLQDHPGVSYFPWSR